MAFSLKGVMLPHRKNTAGLLPVTMPAPALVTIPASGNMGAPATVCVKVGDEVKIGDLIAEQNGFISSPVHASVSGKVVKITQAITSRGELADFINIESDGLMQVSEKVAPPVINNKEEFISAVRDSGLVGLGGAGFPTYVKLMPKTPVDTLIINGAECEPYITSDSIIMSSRADDIKTGISAVQKYLEIKNVIIGIEKNKPEAISSMREMAKSMNGVAVKVLGERYPQGGEKVLIYHTTGRVVKLGQLPSDVGCIVMNSTTCATLGNFLKTGMPLVSKCVTVDGSAVKEPKNVIAPVGTKISDLFEFVGGFKEEPKKIIFGGPMMGVTVPSLDEPICKNNNGVLAFSQELAKLPETTSCIRCGACVNHCPFGINPAAIEAAYRKNDLDGMLDAGVRLCMECGCCSFECPANRPLVQTNRLGKAALAKRDRQNKEEKK